MTSKHTIVINGKVYDAITGLPVAAPTKPVDSAEKLVASHKVEIKKVTSESTTKPHTPLKHHKRPVQKSATLRRDLVKKPTTHSVAVNHHAPLRRTQKSPMVHRFAPHPQPLHEKKSTKTSSIRPTNEHVASIVAQKHQLALDARQKKSSHAVRERSLMAERLAKTHETTPRKLKKTPQRRSLLHKQPRMANVMAASLAIMILGGYLTYLSMPNLSVRVAASQAGVAASFPDYHPDGYRFEGPVSFAPGQVAVKFRSNTNTTNYTVAQQKTTWDSQAVYDNVVASASNGNYTANSKNGLTIYTFDNRAAWVNKGILYTIDGSARLSNDQLLRIAGSM